ncbi:MAG TPA: aminodeoxychorismate synthase component I [Crenotrichaceae bacterium]|nr:aminodeoxychorismate synthase component I [Crenotrichaceae bacterium]
MFTLHQFPKIVELAYLADSARLFSPWVNEPWAVFLDSGYPNAKQGRYDVLAARPFCTIVTRGEQTEIDSVSGTRISSEDPFKIVRQTLSPLVRSFEQIPFSAGAIGYFGYDLARRIEKLPVIAEDAEAIPEMMVGIYDWMVVVDHQQQKSWLLAQGRDVRTEALWDTLVEDFNKYPDNEPDQNEFRLTTPIQSNLDWGNYSQAFDKIQNYIFEGDCYQVNLAQRFHARCEGDSWSLYQKLRKSNPAPFSAYLNFPDVQILSSSPERFVAVIDDKIETKPIKGTRPRGADSEQDLQLINELRTSTKDRAENVMIVDLLRNDIGKNSAIGSVEVPSLFDVESFSTVHHLVSTVKAELEADRHALHLLRGCFPGGSITGAPKIRSMEIIEELEPHRRGVYCGGIGWIGFDGNMDSNIAIRTMIRSDDQVRFWAGGGIVADSDAKSEYQETYDKAAALFTVLEQRLPDLE